MKPSPPSLDKRKSDARRAAAAYRQAYNEPSPSKSNGSGDTLGPLYARAKQLAMQKDQDLWSTRTKTHPSGTAARDDASLPAPSKMPAPKGGRETAAAAAPTPAARSSTAAGGGSSSRAATPATAAADAVAAASPSAAGAVAKAAGSEASACELFNVLLSAVLPQVKKGAGRIIAKLNDAGGLPMAGPLSAYTLLIERKGEETSKEASKSKGKAGPSGGIAGDEILKTLDLEFEHVGIAHEERVRGKKPSSVIVLDVSVNMDVVFSGEVSFCLHGTRWYTPNIGGIGVKDMHLEVDVRVWMDFVGGEVKVGFIEEPQIKWDLEVKILGLDLPDTLEDGLVPFALKKVLGRFDVANPIVVPLNIAESIGNVDVAGAFAQAALQAIDNDPELGAARLQDDDRQRGGRGGGGGGGGATEAERAELRLLRLAVLVLLVAFLLFGFCMVVMQGVALSQLQENGDRLNQCFESVIPASPSGAAAGSDGER